MLLDSQLHISSMEGQISLSNSEILSLFCRIFIPLFVAVSEEY